MDGPLGSAKQSKIKQHALSCGYAEAAFQQWKAVSIEESGALFFAIPTREDLLMSNAGFLFVLEQFWGVNLTVVQLAKSHVGRIGELRCVCGQVIDPCGLHLQSCKHFFKGRRHDILAYTCCEMLRETFPSEVAVKREPLLVELEGQCLDRSSRGDVPTSAFDSCRHMCVDVTLPTPSMSWAD